MKTLDTTPRANSTFKTLEERETYRMQEEILDILRNSKVLLSANDIANIGCTKGYCRPVVDFERLSHTHPYMRVLTDMVTPGNVHFVNNLERVEWAKDCFTYRLRYDVYRTRKGNWRRVNGVELMDYIPTNN